jgi:uncharacterized Tic20 family protein
MKSEHNKLTIGLMHMSGAVFAGFGSSAMYFIWGSDEARKALNWQLTALIMNAVSAMFIHVGIGLILIWSVNIINICCSLWAAYCTLNDKSYEYPLAIQLFKPKFG